MQQLYYLISVVLVCLLMSCTDQQDEVSALEDQPEQTQTSLPFTKMLLEDMREFAPSGANWSIAGSVYADLEQEGHLEMTDGLGVLVNKPKDGTNENLRSVWEHGDLELHLDVLMPKGSNSGVYFQGRYEIQLLDSWKEVEPAHKDIGGVYQQWNDAKPEGEKGFDGVPPSINAARAPGLWQHFHILFRAPRFNADGQKIADARFEYVYLNGMLVQDNVTVSGPTRAHQLKGETPLGPLFLQGDHGPAAFRNIQYKTYSSDTLQLSNISYKTFKGQWNHLPDFDTLEPVKAGKLKHLELKGASESPNDFGVIFTGDLSVPTTGTYLFEMQADDRAILSIGTQRIVVDGDKGGELIRGFAELENGTRSFEIRYQQERGRASLNVRYEGPFIALRPLAKPPSDGNTNSKDRDPILVEVSKVPEMVRGFVMHKGEKKTHTISVGTLDGVHFSYDLRQGALLQAWKGDFADVTNMWQGRGASQLLLPLNAAVEFHAAMPIAHINEHEFWPLQSEGMQYVGYDMDDRQMPIFKYVLDGSQISDQITCIDGKVRRQISVQGNDIEHYDMLLAKAASITRQDNGLYNIDGQYYIDTEEDVNIHIFAEHFELRSRVDKGLASYDIIW